MASEQLVQVKALFDSVFASLPTDREPTVADIRAGYEQMCSALEVAPDASFAEREVSGVPVIEVTAQGAGTDRVLVYLHGGGYVIGSAGGYRSLGAALSRAADARVLLVDYRLAPEHPHPAAIEDATAVYRAVLAGGVDPSRVVVAGDSAGGGLTMATLLALRDAGDRLPAAGVCLSPWVDLALTGASLDARAELDPIVSREMVTMLSGLYLDGVDPRTPLASPLYADLAGLPPLLVLVGTAETLWDDAQRLAERAREAGVDVTLEVGEDMYHVWPVFCAILPEAQDAVDRIGRFVGERTGTAEAAVG